LKGCGHSYDATTKLIKKYGTKDDKYALEYVPQGGRITEEETKTLPYFYKQAYQREYIKLFEPIKVSLKVTKEFYDFFKKIYLNDELRNDVFLGHSESLVSIENIILK